MAKRDKLLDLIHTLSMSEKRYFRLFAQRHMTKNNPQYLALFDLACNQETPESAAFELSVKNAGLTTKYLGADKQYLYGLLLRSLSNFHASRTNSMQVKEWLHQVEILYDKGLYDQCIHLTKKARQAAEKHELYALLMEISLWERKVLEELNEISRIKESHSEVLDHLGFMDNMHAFMLLYYQLQELELTLIDQDEAFRKQKLESFIAHPFLASESVPLSFQATRHFWMIFALYYRLLNDREKELSANERLLKVMDSNKQYREEYPYDYVEVYSRILNLKLYGNSEDFEEWLAFFRAFPKKLSKAPRNVIARVELDAFLFEIPWLIRRKQPDPIPAAMKGLKKNMAIFRRQVTVDQRLEAMFWEARHHEFHGDTGACIQALTPLLNEFGADEGLDLQVFGRILAIQAHFRQQNYPLLPYLADSSLRMLKKHKGRYDMEIWVIRQFRRLAKVEFRGDHYAKVIGKGILENWEEKSSLSSRSRLDEYLDVQRWVRDYLV